MLTTIQLQLIRTDINASVELSAYPNNPDGNFEIARIYNTLAVPDWWLWRTSLPPAEYKGANGIVWSEVDALTTSKARIFEWLTNHLSVALNPSDANQRQGIQDCFAAGTATRANLLALAKRRASRIHKLLSTGTGSSANPAVLPSNLTDAFLITSEQVQEARNLIV